MKVVLASEAGLLPTSVLQMADGDIPHAMSYLIETLTSRCSVFS